MDDREIEVANNNVDEEADDEDEEEADNDDDDDSSGEEHSEDGSSSSSNHSSGDINVLKTRQTAKKSNSSVAATRKELIASPMEVDLRIALFVPERVNSALKWSKSMAMYIGYPEGKIVLVDYPDAERKIPLKSNNTYEQLEQAVKGALPSQYELVPHNEASIRVPKCQYNPIKSPDYWSRKSADFDFITGDNQFIAALASYRTVNTTSSRKRSEAVAKAAEEVDLNLSPDAGTLREVDCKYMVLEIFVSVSTRKQSIQTTYNIDFQTPDKDGNQEEESDLLYQTPSNKVLGTFTTNLGDIDNPKSRIKFGQLRCRLMNYCNDNVVEYKQMIHPDTRIYYAPDQKNKMMQPIGQSAEQFYALLPQLAKRTTKDSDSCTVIFKMRVALSLVQDNEAPYNGLRSESDSEVIQESQSAYDYASPEVLKAKLSAKERRVNAAAANGSESTARVIEMLYNNPASRCFHGLTKEMCEALGTKLGERDFQEGLLDGDNGISDLVAFFGRPSMKEMVSNRVPEREAFPPDEQGNPPSFPPYAAEASQQETCNLALVAAVDVLKSIAEQRNGKKEVDCIGVSFVRKEGTYEDRLDVEWTELSPTDSTVLDLYYFVRNKAFDEGNTLFAFPENEAEELENDTAALHFTLAAGVESGDRGRYHRKAFWAMPLATVQDKSSGLNVPLLPIELSVRKIVRQEAVTSREHLSNLKW